MEWRRCDNLVDFSYDHEQNEKSRVLVEFSRANFRLRHSCRSLARVLVPLPALLDKTLLKLGRKDTVVREIQINYLSGEQFAFKIEFENLDSGESL